MNPKLVAETVQTELFKLNFRRSNEKSVAKMAAEIIDFTEKIAPLLLKKGLKITKGSTATSTRAWQIIYMEPADGSANHNPNSKSYTKIVCSYKFLVCSKYGSQPISLKDMRWLMNDLLMEVEKYEKK